MLFWLTTMINEPKKKFEKIWLHHEMLPDCNATAHFHPTKYAQEEDE